MDPSDPIFRWPCQRRLKKRINNAAGPKSTTNTNFFPNAISPGESHVGWRLPYTEMFVYIAIHPKMCLVTKNGFSAKIGVLFQKL